MSGYERVNLIARPVTVKQTPRIQFSEYTISAAKAFSNYCFMAGFGMASSLLLYHVLLGNLSVNTIADLLAMAAFSFMLGLAGAGAGGGLYLISRISYYDSMAAPDYRDYYELDEGNEQIDDPPVANPELVSISDISGRVVSFHMPDKANFCAFIRSAIMDNGNEDNSVGRNDARNHGITDRYWRPMYNQFLEIGWIRERKNRKPAITANGRTSLGRYLDYHSYQE